MVAKLQGDRIGLMAFAGESFVMCPLTVDYSGFLLTLDDLSTNSIPRGGSDLANPIKEAVKALNKKSTGTKVLVLVTDGEELEGDAVSAAKEAASSGIKVYTIGVGTQEGDLIQVPDEGGQPEFLKDASGNAVKSHLNENLLQQIAYAGNGAYVRSSGAQFGLDFLYEKQLSLLTKQDFAQQMSKQYHERFQWLLALAFVLFMAETWIGLRPHL